MRHFDHPEQLSRELSKFTTDEVREVLANQTMASILAKIEEIKKRHLERRVIEVRIGSMYEAAN